MDSHIGLGTDAFCFTIIRKQYSRMPVNEIADMIERSPAFVQDFIDNHLAGSGELSYQETLELKERDAEKAQQKKKLKALNEVQSKKQTVLGRSNLPKKCRNEDQRMVTKVVDYSQLQTIKIDHKTTIYLQPGENADQARLRYEKAIQRTNRILNKPEKTKDSKVCSRCKIEKDIDDFGKAEGNLDGHREVCKACTNQQEKLTAVNRMEARRLRNMIQ